MDRFNIQTGEKEKLANCLLDEAEAQKPQGAEAQLLAIQGTSSRIWKTSTKFDLDSRGKFSKFDELISERVVQKALESDNLMYKEGQHNDNKTGFPSRREVVNAFRDPENWETVSAGDFDDDFSAKREALAERQRTELGFFESSPYFSRIFPSLKIQKPGYDLYALQSLVLGLCLVFVYVFSDKYTASSSAYKFMKSQSVLFQYELAFVLVIIVFVLVLERIVSRTDTKKVIESTEFGGRDVGHGGQEAFFEQDHIFQRSQTMRSMTVKLRTMKTADLDMGSSSAQKFLQEFDEGGSANVQQSRTKITSQQKCKIFLHWTLLITTHIYVFYYVPTHSSMYMYNSFTCEPNAPYGCKDFAVNIYL